MGAAVLALLLAAPASASDATDIPSIQGRAVDTGDTDLARRMKAALAEDPGRADSLAARILRSSLGPRLAESADPEAARTELIQWIRDNPAAAADLAVGFGRDDADGTKRFENSLAKQAERFLELNPGRNKGILGKLDGLGRASKAIVSDQGMSDDDRRRLMKELFEGRSTVDKAADGGGPKDPGRGAAPAAPAVSGDGFYDRLNAANVTGYSPSVQALQSELNRAAPPGAPRLIETGKLDLATLSYPGLAVQYDLERLAAAQARDLAAAQAAALGERLSPERLADPAIQKDLEARAAGKAPPPGFERRRAALAKARGALDSFKAAAEPARDPKKITKSLLRDLASRRREAARWVQLAALEDILGRLEAVVVRDAVLKESLARAPASEDERRRFWDGGAALENQLKEALAAGRRGAELLGGRDDAASWAEAEKLINAARAASRRLPDEAVRYRNVPERLAAQAQPLPRWRVMLEDAALRVLPSSAYAKAAAARRKNAADARSDFRRYW